MEAEVISLKTQLSKQEVKSQIEKQKDAAQIPLTTEEKQDLIGAIGQLTGERLEYVIELVRASLPPSKRSDDEIEVEIDILDTLTQRKLQDYINAGDAKPAKRAKKETKKQQVQQSAMRPNYSSINNMAGSSASKPNINNSSNYNNSNK